MPYGLFDYVPDSGIHTMGSTPTIDYYCRSARINCAEFPNSVCCGGGTDPLEAECRMSGDANVVKQNTCREWWLKNQCSYTGMRPNGLIGVSCPPRPKSPQPPQPQPPQSGTGVGTCPSSIVENGVRYTYKPPQAITRGNCDYVLDMTPTIAPPVITPPSDSCPAGQSYYEGISGLRGTIRRGCYTPLEYETKYNEIMGIFPYGRRPDNCMIRLADGTCMPELPRAR